MSDQLINEITLECLMNKDQYAKYINYKLPIIQESNKKDKKFYRRRIQQLTKQLLSNELPPVLSADVKYTFETYIKNCVEFFKALDKTDIIQEDHHVDPADTTITALELATNDSPPLNMEAANKLMMRSVQVDYTLDKFVKYKKIQFNKEPPPPLPKQKDINLRDPLLKHKGICKKKNIGNIYEENTKISKETQK